MTDNTPLQEPLKTETAIPARTLAQKLTALIIIAAVLTGGWLFSRSLLSAQPEARRKKPAPMKTIVQLQLLEAADHTSDFEAMGTVIAARQLTVKARVSGRVVEINPRLAPGSHLKAGELIIKIDDEDYRLALERSRNNLQKAAMDLRLEQGNQAVAKREFELIRQYSTTPIKDAPMDLALRKPQLAKARAVEAAARIDVQQAELNLRRTVLKVPFNAVVLKKNITIGSQLTSQSTVAELAGTDTFWIRISLPGPLLASILLPDKDSSPVPVTILPADQNQTGQWQGSILGLLPDVDPQGLMARLLITVPEPLQQNSSAPPLLLGSMVRVLLPGKTIAACFAVPRTAVRPDDTVLLADQDDRLEIRPVTVLHRDNRLAYITAGLQNGERLIISPVAAPIAGMALSLAAKDHASEKPAKPARAQP